MKGFTPVAQGQGSLVRNNAEPFVPAEDGFELIPNPFLDPVTFTAPELPNPAASFPDYRSRPPRRNVFWWFPSTIHEGQRTLRRNLFIY
jgi:hypothetical protein